MSRKYRLKQDLPDAKTGETFTFDGRYYKSETKFDDGCHAQWPPRYVECNPEWFEEIKEEPEVIFTTSIDNVVIRKGDDYWWCGFNTFKKYHTKVCSWQDISKGSAQAAREEAMNHYIYANKPFPVTVIELSLCFETIIRKRGFGCDSEVTTVVDMKKLEALIKSKQQEHGRK